MPYLLEPIIAYSPDQERDDQGQWTDGGGGGPPPGSHQAAYSAAREQYKAARQSAFTGAKERFKAESSKADKVADKLRNNVDDIVALSSPDKATDRFADKIAALDEAAVEYDVTETIRVRAESLNATRAAAKSALRTLEKVKPAEGSDHLSQADIDRNRKNLTAVIAKTTAAVASLKVASKFSREALSIKKGGRE